MGHKLSISDSESLINELKKEYKIYGPKKVIKYNDFFEEEVIAYDEINSINEIIYEEKSEYSIKDIMSTITKTIYYEDGNFKISNLDDEKDILIFARACDINAQLRQDNIYIKSEKDEFYKNLRKKVKFICIECNRSFENCFCVSVESNKTDNYSLAVKFNGNELLFYVADKEFLKYFESFEKEEYKIQFIEKNNIEVPALNIKSEEEFERLSKLKLWESFNEKCIECGKCNLVCSISSRFATIELKKCETSSEQIHVFCATEGFDAMIGGYNFMKSQSEKMKNKVFYKFYMYKNKFNTPLCVGCGRCIDQCPEGISLINIVKELSEEIEK